MAIIRGYGEFWNPELVTWGSKGPGNGGKLLGEASPSDGPDYKVDMWKATAVYCLYLDFSVVYVGRSERNLGSRLKNHRADHKQGRWDLSSFYSLSVPNRNGRCSVAGQRQVTPAAITKALEAMAIRMFDPPLNRRHERFDGEKKAIPIAQRGEVETVRGLLYRLDQRLDELEGQLATG